MSYVSNQELFWEYGKLTISGIRNRKNSVFPSSILALSSTAPAVQILTSLVPQDLRSTPVRCSHVVGAPGEDIQNHRWARLQVAAACATVLSHVQHGVTDEQTLCHLSYGGLN